MGQVELIWGAFSLMILGALISMCMKCQQTGSKQEKANVDNQRTQFEEQQDCDEHPYLSSMSKESQMKETYHTSKQSKSGKLSSFHDLEDDSHSQTEDDSTYVEPLSSHHYHNWPKATGLSSDDDSHRYQNVIGTIKTNQHKFFGECSFPVSSQIVICPIQLHTVVAQYDYKLGYDNLPNVMCECTVSHSSHIP